MIIVVFNPKCYEGRNSLFEAVEAFYETINIASSLSISQTLVGLEIGTCNDLDSIKDSSMVYVSVAFKIALNFQLLYVTFDC
jgi:hypothetical protein